tara:strand:+ start:133 stop:342 length:210 start_codon:yes stop_codon:yes gene_type:complete
MFATENIQYRLLKLILIIIKTIMNIIALILTISIIISTMIVEHLTEGINGLSKAIKIEEEDINSIVTKK